MAPLSRLCALLLPLPFLLLSLALDEPSPAAAAANSSRLNATLDGGGLFPGLGVDSSMIQRSLYVLIGFTGLGVLYFLIRAVRLKKPVQKKKYGLLLNYNDSVEMEAVESDEDDTLFESRGLRR